MDDLHSRAAALLQGPGCISREERMPGRESAVGLIGRYVKGGSWDDPEIRKQLSECLSFAQREAVEQAGDSGPERDARHFYQRAAAILQEIQAKIS